MSDPHNLARFLDAQAPLIDRVRAELTAGSKRTHWMWFIFPQLQGLGRSEAARFYGLAGLEEARAFLAHQVLGQRLKELTEQVLATPANLSAHDIFGSPDDLKFRSSMTLFARVNPEEPSFRQALARFYGAAPDPLTLAVLARSAPH